MTDVFPQYKGALEHPGYTVPNEYSPIGGLTKRELFAAMAMQGLMAVDVNATLGENQRPSERRAELAIKHADSLIAALAKEPG